MVSVSHSQSPSLPTADGKGQSLGGSGCVFTYEGVFTDPVGNHVIAGVFILLFKVC